MNTDLASPWEPLPEDAPQTEPAQFGFMDALARGVGLGLLCTGFLATLVTVVALGIYVYYARSLPSPQELYQRASPYRSTKMFDRRGRLLYEVFSPASGRRTIVRYDQLPPVLIAATVATEDATFFTNPGFNPFAIARALFQNLRSGEVVSGASGITQQLAKNLFLTQDRTLSRKVKEAILAAEVTRRYSKEEILEVYLNEMPFGNMTYGIGAAAETYFGKSASELGLSEAALLAGILQSPSLHDPYTNPEDALQRRNVVLGLMRSRDYITQEEYEAAVREPLRVVPRSITMEAPHMVMYVREELEKLYGTEMLYKGGLQVYTTLDLDLQHLAEAVAREKIGELQDQDASNVALLAMDPRTGDVLAMLGSVDFHDRSIDGQVNVCLMPRQPGSTIKPFTYLAAMERGWTPSTMLMDVYQDFPDGANPPYRPTNYDSKEWGPVSLRTALACSRNIPAVSTLSQVGVPALVEIAHRLGMSSLDRSDYGLSLTLGGGEVTALELTAAYAALANGGHRVTPRLILRIEDQEGNVVMPERAPDMPLVVDPRHAYLLTDILADNQARAPGLGSDSPLNLSFPAAGKTGTTNDYRDSWTVGYIPDLVSAVWVGNNDNRPMKRVSGSRGAALIWHDFMERALGGTPRQGFARPDGLVQEAVCPVSGQKRGDGCPPARTEWFLAENRPTADCPVHRRLRICGASGKEATSLCPAEGVHEQAFEDYGPAWDEWAIQKGLSTPPRGTCPIHQPSARVALAVPAGPLQGVVEVRGSASVVDMAHYVVEYGIGPDPQGWGHISPEVASAVKDGVLCVWDTRPFQDGTYSLRLVVSDLRGDTFEARAVVQVHNLQPGIAPTATPVEPPSRMPTVTPVPTAMPEPSSTSVPSATPWPSPTATWAPTVTPPATATGTSGETPLPSHTPSATAGLPPREAPTLTLSVAPVLR
jgi:1A family penicillin-binding protein